MGKYTMGSVRREASNVIDEGQDRPARCPECDGAVVDGERAGVLWCAGCDWPVWMAFGGGWVATPRPGPGDVERFREGLGRIVSVLLEVDSCRLNVEEVTDVGVPV